MEDGEEVIFFYSRVRESAIAVIAVTALCWVSYSLLKRVSSSKIAVNSQNDEKTVHNVVFGVCTLSLAVTIGGVVLLIFSVLSNEIHLAFPNSPYTQWIDKTLFTGLWNNLFFASNVCLLLLLPFGYFFMDAEGFIWSKKGLFSKIYESLIIVALTVLLLGLIVWVGLSLWQQHTEYSTVLTVHHNIYSVVALFGVLLSTVCAPLGLSRCFTVLSIVITRPPPSSPNVKDVLQMKEVTLERRLHWRGNVKEAIEKEMSDVQEELHDLVTNTSKGILYPIVFSGLLIFTIVSFVLVGLNCLSLLFTEKDFLVHIENLGGVPVSLVAFVVQILVIASFGPSVLLGFYTLPSVVALIPRKHKMSLTTMLVTCVVYITLGSALPLLLSTLGLMRFKVFGNFLSFPWLESRSLRLGYNLVFEGLTCLILSQKVSLAVIRRLPRTFQFNLSKKSKKLLKKEV